MTPEATIQSPPPRPVSLHMVSGAVSALEPLAKVRCNEFGLWRLSVPQRRWLIFSLCFLWTLVVTIFFNRHFFRGRLDSLDLLAALIYLVLLVANSFNLLVYIFGFWVCRAPQLAPIISSCDQREVESECLLGRQSITTKTALVMPIYHEEMNRVYAGVRQTWLSVKEAGLSQQCDFYLLCDSTDPQICEQEERVHRELLREFENNGRESGGIFLIRRTERKNFKAGNIANFLVSHAGAYDFMLVLDADSVMLGERIKRLILKMQASPRLAVLQTVIMPIRAITPFARSMQYFIGRCVATLYSSGMYWFSGTDSFYWGHNALIRIAPFIVYCNLPIMPGKPPLGGPIMSQDFVEAALLGRAGWAVEWDLLPGGSFDELPANLISYGQRDRRWCQGNLRNFWLMFGDRMKFVQRLGFGICIMAYVSSLLFLLMTFLGFIQAVRGRSYRIESTMFWSFIGYLLVLVLLPKILGLVRIFQLKKTRNLKKEVASMLLEFGLVLMSAPTLFYLHSLFVIKMLLGKSILWTSQPRNPAGQLSWSEGARAFWAPTLLGIFWLGLAAWLSPFSLSYLATTLLGWVFSIPFAVLSSNVALGTYFTRHGLFDDCLTPAEVEALGALLNGNLPYPGLTNTPTCAAGPASAVLQLV